ncbi:hypothetical protein KKG31_03810 [Patescibacteria group bacterium]|nr:hypothetical protein [Patescibacteria group bacterium]MBU1758269.1 hypothetical protein [Patescibacteria group bacterium]
MPAGTLVYSKAFAKNIFGVGYSSQSSFWTRPDAPIITSPTKIDNEGLVARREHTTGANNYSLYLALDS